ncbi:MAG: transcription elongation factor GreA [Clostridia bacterium]|nr:transcription elongation factor GreA [Clostridia bacterium]
MAEKILITLRDKQRMEEELAQLTAEKKRISEDIKTALGFGDLSENAEYHEAKENEGKLYGRISDLEAKLRMAEVIDDTEISTETVGLGVAVRVLDLELDMEDTYTIVGPTEVDPDKLYITVDSPIGAALNGGSVGEIVEARTPGGVVKLKILAIDLR